MKRSKIIFHFSNGEEYEMIGFRNILIDALKDKEDYILAKIGMYIMKNNINYIKIEDIEEKKEEK